MMRREEHYIGRSAMEMEVQGRRKRGRPDRRWYQRDCYKKKFKRHGSKMKKKKKKKFISVNDFI